MFRASDSRGIFVNKIPSNEERCLFETSLTHDGDKDFRRERRMDVERKIEQKTQNLIILVVISKFNRN
jgi:hypothetical protein